MEINYLIIIVFILLIFNKNNKNNIENFTTTKRCKNGKKENGENCDCDEFNKRCPTKKEALDFIKKYGKTKLADLSPQDEKGCKQCHIDLGDKGPHCQKRVIDCGDNKIIDPKCLNNCNNKFKYKENAKRCCIARNCKYPGNDYYSKKKKEEACTVKFVRSSSGETVASTSVKNTSKNKINCYRKCSKEHPNNIAEKKCCIVECRFPGNDPDNLEFKRINCEEANKMKQKQKESQKSVKTKEQNKQTQEQDNSKTNNLPISIDDNLKTICAQLFD